MGLNVRAPLRLKLGFLSQVHQHHGSRIKDLLVTLSIKLLHKGMVRFNPRCLQCDGCHCVFNHITRRLDRKKKGGLLFQQCIQSPIQKMNYPFPLNIKSLFTDSKQKVVIHCLRLPAKTDNVGGFLRVRKGDCWSDLSGMPSSFKSRNATRWNNPLLLMLRRDVIVRFLQR